MRNDRRRVGSDSLADDDPVAQLLRYVDGALARTRVHQLTRLPETRTGQEATAPALWIAELPFQGPRGLETLGLHVEREPTSAPETITTPPVWRIVLRLELGETGAMHALLQMRGRRVGATLWAERNETFHAARDRLEELAGMLRQKGVEIETLDCRHGVPPSSLIPTCGPLLDVRI
jgi:hypothetical protein